MAADYTDTATLKDELKITDTTDDARLGRAITDASRVIDAYLGRQPGEFAAQTLTRYYDVPAAPHANQTPPGPAGIWSSDQFGALQRLPIDALQTVTTLSTDAEGDGIYETVWTTPTDYLLYPLNLPTKREIAVNLVTGRYAFPAGLSRVQIVGVWEEGSAIPGPIRRATLLQAIRYWKRPESPLGIEGGGQTGFVKLSQGKLDPDAEFILNLAGYAQAAFVIA